MVELWMCLKSILRGFVGKVWMNQVYFLVKIAGNILLMFNMSLVISLLDMSQICVKILLFVKKYLFFFVILQKSDEY